MVDTPSYPQPLRAIGQALEVLNVDRFGIEPDGEDLLVRGSVTVPVSNSIESPLSQNSLRHIWGFVPGEKSSRLPTAPATVTQLDLRYTLRDIERLEQEGQARREHPEGMAHAGSLSQLLRTVGAYLDEQRGRLAKISCSGDSVVLEYDLPSGRRNEETLTVSGLHDFWVRMYMKRASRAREP